MRIEGLRTKAVLGILALALAGGGVAVLASGYGMGSGLGGTQPLTEAAKQALLTALTGPEGEYAAYAMYTAVIEEYGEVEPYLTIREAEARHIQALQRLLDRYGVEYPVENPYLGQVTAPESLEEAARAWAEGEIANVAMYDRLLEAVEGYPDITRVFQNLRRASLEAHLPAFQAAAESGGVLTQVHAGEGMGHPGGRGPQGRAFQVQGCSGHRGR